MKKVFIPTPLGDTVRIPKEETHHLLRVFRHPVEEPITVGGSDGRTGLYKIEAVTDGSATATCLEIFTAQPKRVQVILVQAFLKGERFEWVLQKATELGVSRICAVKTENCVVKYTGEKLAGKRPRWEKIIREAAQQCGRDDLPTLDIYDSAEAVLASDEGARWFVAYEDEQQHTLRQRLEPLTDQGVIGIVIGPEGGFGASEIAALEASGVATASLGHTVLRAETAAIAAVSMINYRYME